MVRLHGSGKLPRGLRRGGANPNRDRSATGAAGRSRAAGGGGLGREGPSVRALGPRTARTGACLTLHGGRAMSKPFDATLKDLGSDHPVDFLATFDAPPGGPVSVLNVDL